MESTLEYGHTWAPPFPQMQVVILGTMFMRKTMQYLHPYDSIWTVLMALFICSHYMHPWICISICKKVFIWYHMAEYELGFTHKWTNANPNLCTKRKTSLTLIRHISRPAFLPAFLKWGSTTTMMFRFAPIAVGSNNIEKHTNNWMQSRC